MRSATLPLMTPNVRRQAHGRRLEGEAVIRQIQDFIISRALENRPGEEDIFFFFGEKEKEIFPASKGGGGFFPSTCLLYLCDIPRDKSRD